MNEQPTYPPSEPKPPARPNPSSVYPEPTATQPPAEPYVGLSASQMQTQEKKKPLPVGLYIIAGFNMLGFALSFLDSSQSSFIYTIAMFLSLAIAIGLLLRLEIARKFMVGLSVVILVLTGVSLLLLAGLQQRIHQRKADYDAAISKIDQSKITTAQKQQLATISQAIADQEKQAGKAITFTYAKLGVTAVASIAIVVYLTRPKVKEVFHSLEA